MGKEQLEYTIVYATAARENIKAVDISEAEKTAHKKAAKNHTIVISVKLNTL
jgi:hypothetical protein